MNKDGFITKEEFQKVLGGVYLDEEAWSEFLSDCDVDRDGKVLNNFKNISLDFKARVCGVYPKILFGLKKIKGMILSWFSLRKINNNKNYRLCSKGIRFFTIRFEVL